jgi:hypothetical protein
LKADGIPVVVVLCLVESPAVVCESATCAQLTLVVTDYNGCPIPGLAFFG